ncbi:MAG: EboA domain-containing protein [Phormidesmis sp.]
MSALIAPSNLPASSPIFKQLYDVLRQQLSRPAAEWLMQTLDQVANAQSVRPLLTGFSTASRQVGKADLERELLNPDEHNFRHWSTDQAARTLLLLTFPSGEAARYQQVVQRLLDNADVSEQVALYQSLPFLPYPESYCAQAVEGVRSAMTAVFEAIALRNPYPATYFDEPAWNQMVLKALFEGSELSAIEGLDQRANPQLAQMLCDYAHERWAANRPVNPQLWRPVAPFAQGEMLADLQRGAQHTATEKRKLINAE